MNLRRWRTGYIYLVLGIILFGVSTFLFRQQENIDDLPTGTEVIKQDYEANQKVTENIENVKDLEVAKHFNSSFLNEEARVKAELALIGIKSEENPNKNGALVEGALKGKNTKTVEAKSLKDFPSPIQGGRIKSAGNYYSEAFQAYLFHAGTDYAQAEGAVIRVKHPGKVIYAGPDPILGQKVELDCGEDWSVIYGGLENLRVKEGDHVEVNQAIGQVGYYANAVGVKDQPQLHFEVWHGDEVQIPSS